ncbi:MAG: hypothetical protein J1D88_02840 [Treponema sp.]|nr:hypothetical protein [Treponema sp.]
MRYEIFAEEIKTLPEQYISELGDFINYLKLKAKFQDFEHRADPYKTAVANWRSESKELFGNPDDAAFMESAFDSARRREPYTAKEIW